MADYYELLRKANQNTSQLTGMSGSGSSQFIPSSGGGVDYYGLISGKRMAPIEPVSKPKFVDNAKTFFSNVSSGVKNFLSGEKTIKTNEPYRQPIQINQEQQISFESILNASNKSISAINGREEAIKSEIRSIVADNLQKPSLLSKILPGYQDVGRNPALIDSLTDKVLIYGAGAVNQDLKALKKSDRKRIETLIYENSNLKKSKKLYEQIAEGDFKEDRGFLDGLKEGFVDSGYNVPFGKEIANIVDRVSGFDEVKILWEASQKQKDGLPLSDIEQSYMDKYKAKAFMDAVSNRSFGYVVGASLAQMPKFGLEMYLTAGLSSVPSGYLKGAPVFQTLATKLPLVEKITRGLISSVPQTLGFTPRAVDMAREISLKDPSLIEVDGEPMLRFLEQKEGQSFSDVVIKNLPKSFAQQYIEVAGERFGDVLDYAGQHLIKSYLTKRGINLVTASPSTWQKFLGKIGLNSLLSEYAEEVVQNASSELLEDGKFTVPFSTPENSAQQLATLLTVGIYGGLMRVPGSGSRATTKVIQDFSNNVGVDVDIQKDTLLGADSQYTIDELKQMTVEEKQKIVNAAQQNYLLEQARLEPKAVHVGGFYAELTPEQAVALNNEVGTIPSGRVAEDQVDQVHLSAVKFREGQDTKVSLDELSKKFDDVRVALENAGITADMVQDVKTEESRQQTQIKKAEAKSRAAEAEPTLDDDAKKKKKRVEVPEKGWVRFANAENRSTRDIRGGTWFTNKAGASVIEDAMNPKNVSKVGIGGSKLFAFLGKPKSTLTIEDALLEDGSFAVINNGYENYLPSKYKNAANELYERVHSGENLSSKKVDRIITEVLTKAGFSKKQISDVLTLTGKNKFDSAMDLIVATGLRGVGYDSLQLKQDKAEHLMYFGEAKLRDLSQSKNKKKIPKPTKKLTPLKEERSDLKNRAEELKSESQGRAEVAKDKRAGLNTENIAKLKKIYYRSQKFQEGDLETIRSSNSGKLLDRVIENVQEKFPDMSEQEAFDYALNLPTKYDEKARQLPELTRVKSRLKEIEAEYQQYIKKNKLAAGVRKKAIANGLRTSFGAMPEYEMVKIDDQAEEALKLLVADKTYALDIALGKVEPPPGLLAESVFVAVENDTLARGDVDTIRALATESKLVSEATEMGQRLRMLAERNPYSPSSAIDKVIKKRQNSLEERTGKSVDQLKKETVNQIKQQVEKTQPKKSDWVAFIDSIKC